MRAAAFVLFAFLAASAGAAPRFFAPAFLKTGGLNECYAWDEDPLPAFTVDVVRSGAEKAFTRARSFTGVQALGVLGAPDNRPLKWAAALVAVDALEAPGPVTLLFRDAQGAVLFEAASEVHPRAFPVEEIPLDRQMTALRSQPDPRKDREAAEIWAAYRKFNRQARWPGGRFQLPVTPGTPVSALFGDTRKYLYTDGTTSKDYHRGTDFAVPVGTPVSAAAAGMVVLASSRKLTGNTVVIEHAPGVCSVYFHMSRLTVKPGQKVAAGDSLGLSGATGLVTGPHLHWEVRIDGTPVDPLDLVGDGLLDTRAVTAVISSVERPIH